MDLKLLTTMMLPAVLMLLICRKAENLSSNMIIMATLLFVNGLILYIPQFLPSSNKDSRTLSRVEGLLMGIGGAFFAIPGLSGTGAALSLASVTGVERKYGLDMVLMMHMAVLAGKILYDLLDLIAVGMAGLSLMGFVCALICLVVSFAAAFLAVRTLRGLAESKGFGGFAYYSWGLALFTFVLTLMA
jgi:undecaprenyl pyrophosphate phosphatase UppP